MNPAQLLSHFDRTSEAPDAIPRLRRFVLDLAVRGMLVEQDPKDEPAADLLKRVQAERTRLVHAGELRRSKPLPPLEPAEAVFGAPSGWTWARIREVTSDRGQAVPDSDFTYIDVTAIDNESGRIADAKVLAASEAPSRARKVVRKGDVLYSCVRPYLLNVAVVETDITPSPIASTAFAVLNGYGLIVPKFLWSVLRSRFMVEAVEAKMRGQAYPAINDSDFEALPLAVPPLAEQARIVAKVDELMALCDRLGAAQAKRDSRRAQVTAACLHGLSQPDADLPALRAGARFYLRHIPRLTTCSEHIDQLRRTILNLAIHGRLVPQDPDDEPASGALNRVEAEKHELAKEGVIRKCEPRHSVAPSEVPFGLPIGWSWGRVEDVFTSVTDGDHLPPPKTEEGIPFLVIGNVRSRSISFDGSRRVSSGYYNALDAIRKPGKGDLLYTLVGSYGIPVVVKSDRPFCVQRHIGILRPATNVNVEFLATAMASPFVRKQAMECATGIAQKTVPLSGLRRILLPVPPLAEQRRIVAKVDELVALCDRLEEEVTTARTRRSQLLEAAVHFAAGNASRS